MSYKKTLLLACFSAVGSGGAHAATISKDVSLTIEAEIVAETCRQILIDGDDELILNLSDIQLKEVQQAKANNSTISRSLADKKITFQCSSGTYANFSVSASTNDRCITDGGPTYTCSGDNKSIAMAPSIRWITPSGSTASVTWSHGVDRVYEVRLNNNIGEILLPTIYMRTTRDQIPEPGHTEARFTIKIWEP
ncbi:hypothetical protein [Aeromonas veronii]|uniref:hypothetical protein n=1 Tax=Aeromonas veronii TaxID=654 RepID=UPI002714AB3E|nr:hypothetical protein [Aeromonas veronii]WLD19800.1 hypothetical protein O1Q77_16755 [Aeromonas veronii]